MSDVVHRVLAASNDHDLAVIVGRHVAIYLVVDDVIARERIVA